MAADASETCDVFLASSYLTTPLLRIPTVAVVHDLIAFDRRLRPPARSVVVERTRLAAAVRAARTLLVPSRSTQAALTTRLPEAATKTAVMPLGVARSLATRAGPSRRERFVLAVGLAPRKNVETLVEAFRSLPPDLGASHRLLVAGETSRGARRAVRAVRSLGTAGALLGGVDDATLAGLYRRCAVFCFPSLAEGFGLPVLEAMSAGAAVLSSDRGSLPEIGGEAVDYAPPDDPAAWSDALAALLRSPDRREELGLAARARAEPFTWSRAAAIARDALERAAEPAGSPQPVRAAPRAADVADQRSK